MCLQQVGKKANIFHHEDFLKINKKNGCTVTYADVAKNYFKFTK